MLEKIRSIRGGCLVLLPAAVLVGACGSAGDAPTGFAAGGPDQEYEADVLVLEDSRHGPQLCLGGVNTSDPPRCEGPDLVGFRWSDVPNVTRRGGTTWAGVHVRGTYDGSRFTVTKVSVPKGGPQPSGHAPDLTSACTDPEVVGTGGMTEWEEIAGDRIVGLVASWVTGAGGSSFTGHLIVRPGNASTAREVVRATYRGPLCLVERDQPTMAELAGIRDRAMRKLGRRALSGFADNRHGKVHVTAIVATDAMRAELEHEFGPGVVELDGRLQPVQ